MKENVFKDFYKVGRYHYDNKKNTQVLFNRIECFNFKDIFTWRRWNGQSVVADRQHLEILQLTTNVRHQRPTVDQVLAQIQVLEKNHKMSLIYNLVINRLHTICSFINA